MATPNRKKVVITNSTLGNVVAGGKIKNLKMYSSFSPRPQRQVQDDFCEDSDADFIMAGTVAGNVVITDDGIQSIEMISEEHPTGFGDQQTYQRDTSGHPVQQVDTDLDNVYKITSNPRGRVMMVDNLANEAGDNSNVERMKNMWLHLGYMPQTYTNLTADDLKSKVKKFSQKKYLQHEDCVVLIILCNGDRSEIQGSDGEPVSVDELTRNFDVANCRNMANKPKLMFFEYCMADDVYTDSNPGDQNIRGRISDTYIAHKVSMKSDVEGGSKFIKAIDNEFREGAKNTDIHDLMSKVGFPIRTEDSLNKRFYFQ